MKQLKKIAAMLLLATVFFACTKGKDPNAPIQEEGSPNITGFSPASAGYDDVVTITGTGFNTAIGLNYVMFNNVPATVTAATATVLTVTVPKNKAATGKIQVTVDGKTATSATGFTYTPTPTVSTLAGSGTPTMANGIGAAASFNHPVGITLDAYSGFLYVTDNGNFRIRKMSPDGSVSVYAGNGTEGINDGDGNAAQFLYPYGITTDAAGNVYVGDKTSVRKIANNQTRTVSHYATLWPTQGRTAYGIAIDPSTGALYFGDIFYSNQNIGKISSGVVSTFAANFYFSAPIDVAVASGYLYVADAAGYSILKAEIATQKVTVLAGGTAAGLNLPGGLALDAAGNVYVGDTGNHRIRKITPAGVVTTIAGTGAADFADGKGTVAKFNNPEGIAVTKDGSIIYVADYDNHRIRKITFE
jgi:sugar lactone lactonase YvrE